MDTKQKFDYFLILDWEAVFQDANGTNSEIIEFPTVLFDAVNMKTIDEFHYYLKPKINVILNDICVKTTGITQDIVDKGISLEDALDKYDEWLSKHDLISKETGKLKNAAFVTCGNWDIGKQLPNQCKRENIEKHLRSYFSEFINIKELFQKYYNLKREIGMAGMLKHLKLTLTGKHHSGIDDCRNITKIVKKMIEANFVLDITRKVDKK